MKNCIKKSKNKKYVERKLSKEERKQFDKEWVLPKPKYDMYEVVKRATAQGLSYGKYVALNYELGLTL